MRIVFIIAGVLLLSSCKKEETPEPEQVIIEAVNPHCLCGKVGNKRIQTNGYFGDVTNNCSNNVKTFALSWDEYTSGDFCAKDGQTW